MIGNNKVELEDILKFDALKKAEEISGKEYQKDKATQMAGLWMHTINTAVKKELLKSMNDTYYSMEFKDFLKVFEENNIFNFEIAYENDFVSEGYNEKEIIYCCVEKGIFIYVCSWHNHLNNCNVYMQLKDNKEVSKTLDGSFSYKGDEIVLHLDGREALFYSLIKYDMVCEYATPWKHDMFLFFENYTEKNSKDTTLEKVKMMDLKYRKILKVCMKGLKDASLCKR